MQAQEWRYFFSNPPEKDKSGGFSILCYNEIRSIEGDFFITKTGATEGKIAKHSYREW